MRKLAKKLIEKIPYVHHLRMENDELRSKLTKLSTWKPPGHFYSPIPSLEEVKKYEAKIFSDEIHDLKGLDINEIEQLKTLALFSQFYADIPFKPEKNEHHRYYYDNAYYSYADGIVLYCMLRILHPKRIIEIGSGFSSALMLDVNDLFLNRQLQFTFVEPYPERLKTLLRKSDYENVTICDEQVQDLPGHLFSSLNDGDVLFIDSSHVSKVGSDVNYLLFDVLPTLKSGVYIHFHDIFYPFEYPRGWVYEGVAWNEAYALHAFLQYNDAFKIEFFTSYLLKHHQKEIMDVIPLALKSETENISLNDDAPGASIWLKKL